MFDQTFATSKQQMPSTTISHQIAEIVGLPVLPDDSAPYSLQALLNATRQITSKQSTNGKSAKDIQAQLLAFLPADQAIWYDPSADKNSKPSSNLSNSDQMTLHSLILLTTDLPSQSVADVAQLILNQFYLAKNSKTSATPASIATGLLTTISRVVPKQQIPSMFSRLLPLFPTSRQPLIASVVQLAILTALIDSDEINQATAFLARVDFPLPNQPQEQKSQSSVNYARQNFVNQAVLARWEYQSARLKALLLDYSAALNLFQAAQRGCSFSTSTSIDSKTNSSSSNNKAGRAFAQSINKHIVIVRLLTGEIPERSLFTPAQLGYPAVNAYKSLVLAVRQGEIGPFQESLQEHASQFKRDGTATLVARLRQTVISVGLRSLSIAYSRISLKDVCEKLGLGSVQDAEYVVAKAIRDGVLLSTLHYPDLDSNTKGDSAPQNIVQMCSAPQGDAYVTNDPTREFSTRVAACQAVYRRAVAGMRYPEKSTSDELNNVLKARSRNARLLEEIADAAADGEDEGDDDLL